MSLGGGPSTVSQQQQNDSYNEYQADTASVRRSIMSDASIDSISRQELLNELNYNNGIDVQHTGDSTQAQISKVEADLQVYSSDDPLYVGRRYNEDVVNKMIAQPGRMQTMLTAADTTPQGTQTLLTASAGPTTPNIPAAPGG